MFDVRAGVNGSTPREGGVQKTQNKADDLGGIREKHITIPDHKQLQLQQQDLHRHQSSATADAVGTIHIHVSNPRRVLTNVSDIELRRLCPPPCRARFMGCMVFDNGRQCFIFYHHFL